MCDPLAQANGMMPMSGYKEHIIFGIALAGLAAYYLTGYGSFEYTPVQALALFLVVLVYSILPDLDSPSSKIRKLIQTLGLASLLILIYFNLKLYLVVVCVFLLAVQFLTHRRFMHSIAAGVILSLPLAYFDYFLALFAFAAYLSHLLLDGEVKLT